MECLCKLVKCAKSLAKYELMLVYNVQYANKELQNNDQGARAHAV